jgi:hypothetical protein
MTTDPFMAAAPAGGITQKPGDFWRDDNGTPYISDPTGAVIKPRRKADPPRVKRVRYKRPSGYGDDVLPSFTLAQWQERQLLLGITLGIGEEAVARCRKLLPARQEEKAWRDEADNLVRLAKKVAKSELSADRGTHAHAITEDDDADRDWVTRAEAGADLGIPIEAQRGLVEAWRKMLAEYGLEVLASELPIVNDIYRCAGTLDRIVRLTRDLIFTLPDGRQVFLRAGTVLVLDIKSGKLRHKNGVVEYWRNYPIQIVIYAGGVPYDVNAETRLEWPYTVDQDWALIAHLDVLAAIEGTPTCSLIAVSLREGRHGADLAREARIYAANNSMFSLADTHTVSLTIDVPPPPAPEPVILVAPRRYPIELRIANLRERCNTLTELHPSARQWLINNFEAAQISLTNPDLDHTDADAAQFIVEEGERVLSAPFNDLFNDLATPA